MRYISRAERMITIKIEEYDTENKFLSITKGEKNLFGLVSIMQFE